jgi:hypothetical protein
VVKIERKKSFLLTCERKRVSVEVFHSRWFGRDTSLGKAELKLSELTTKSEVKEVAPLLEGRRSTGGSVEVIFRLRKPLLKADIRTIQWKKLVIHEHLLPGEPISSSSSLISPVSASVPTPSSISSAPTPNCTPTSTTPTSTLSASAKGKRVPSKATPKQPATAPTTKGTTGGMVVAKPAPTQRKEEGEGEEDMTDYNSLENMVSNSVLEWELNNVKARIQGAKANKLPVPEELEDR